jgi:hypothetical protein
MIMKLRIEYDLMMCFELQSKIYGNEHAIYEIYDE